MSVLKIRSELEYTADPNRDGYWYVRDPFWGRFLSFNEIQVEMMRALDGSRTLDEVYEYLGDELGIDCTLEQIESFIQRLQRERLLDNEETHQEVQRILEKAHLSLEEVAARLGEPGFHIYDVNGEARWKRSHVPGALPVNAYLFERHEMPADTSATVVFYCTHDG